MIDTHLHILPGVDDGPETLQEALALARLLVQEGIHAAVATPHYNDDFPRRSVSELRERVRTLQYALDQGNIPLRLYVGHEARIQEGLLEDLQVGRLATLNESRYLLLELWDSMWLPETERVIFELMAHSIIPIIAHPERCYALQQQPDRLIPLLRQGVLTQLVASSLIGAQGKAVCRCAETLLKKGLISCIASDAHGAQRRRPHVLRGLQRAEQLTSPSFVQYAVELGPEAIINNEVYEREQVSRARVGALCSHPAR